MHRTGWLLLAGALLAATACGGGKSANTKRGRGTASPAPAAAGAADNGLAQAGQAPPANAPVQGAGPAPADTGPAAGPAASAGLTVFGDTLAGRWEDWSWNATVTLAATTPVYTGVRAVAVTVNAPWGALYFHTDIPTDLTPYTYLRFAAQVSEAGQRYAVALVDTNNKLLATPFFLATFGDISVGGWKYYRVPLAELGATGKAIKGIIIEDGLGKPQPPLFIDDLGFQ